jgi:hypothetical protein
VVGSWDPGKIEPIPEIDTGARRGTANVRSGRFLEPGRTEHMLEINTGGIETVLV